MGREVMNEQTEAPLCSSNDLGPRINVTTVREDLEEDRTYPERTGPVKPAPIRWCDLPNKDQLFILSLCRLSEPLSNVCLLPYIFYLVRSVLPPSPPSSIPNLENDPSASPPPPPTPESAEELGARISKFSGLLVAAFPLAQFLVSLPWGRLSDRHGRRFSIVAGLAVSVIANVGFGFSRSIDALFFWRVLAGLANGNVGIMRTVTAEVVRERKFQTKAFLLLPLVFNAGMVASLALGGCLAEPVVNLPGLFGSQGWFNAAGNPEGVQWALDHPYALPALLNAAILGVSLLLAVLGLKETLPGKESQSDIGLKLGAVIKRRIKLKGRRRRRRQRASPESEEEYAMLIESSEDTFIGQTPPDPEKPDPTGTTAERRRRLPFRSLWTRRVLCAMVSFGLLPLHNSAFMHIFPVYLSSPPADNVEASMLAFTGGLGLRSSTIGIWLSVFGICGILLQLFIYPRLQARIGTRGVFRIALFLFPVTYAAAPYLSLLSGDDEGALRWVCLGMVVCAQIMARTMAIPSTVILLTEAAPSRTVLGTIHGAGNMLASLARAVGPAIGGYVFAWGVEEGVIGLVWWMYLVIIAMCALAWSYILDRDEE
ncbi:MFS general substrate transporter [Hypoxylon fragiforme]|uniref:MFS general substrate transporter n=1 Tax=Hypoxylon fragiforme TaxID=63214 RepID=UPI0020C65079|nr:MFS general substrate transporter [Hypoxylon fragiforme]KAI2607776.1 MFS general substrate transporter [Hypoxylon fragiforme]